jgi:hypothetical protein
MPIVAGWGLQQWGISQWGGATQPATGMLGVPGFTARWGNARYAMARYAYPIIPRSVAGQPTNTPDMTGGFRSGSMHGGFHG